MSPNPRKNKQDKENTKLVAQESINEGKKFWTVEIKYSKTDSTTVKSHNSTRKSFHLRVFTSFTHKNARSIIVKKDNTKF